MGLFPVYHTYCSEAFFRDTLAGSAYSSGWTQDADTILKILERASRLVDSYVGDQTFGPTTETRLYDLGGSESWYMNNGPLRSDPRPIRSNARSLQTYDYRASVVPLDRWLVSATTVTAYADTARTTSDVLVEGIAEDYLLEPYNTAPKYRLKLNEDSTLALGVGQQVLSILGTWGWQYITASASTLSAAITTTTATTLTVASLGNHGAGNTIVVDSEQMYCTGHSSTTLTVRRGVNGTTAATHLINAAVSIVEHPSDVKMVTADLARMQYRDRDLGVVETIGSGGQGTITRSSSEMRSTLSTLDHYRVARDSAGLVF